MVSGSMTVIALIVAIVFIIILTARFKVNAFIVLILAGILYGFMVCMPLKDIMKNIQGGFGSTLGYIGIVIIAGTIMGIILEKTGAAFSITNSILKIIGNRFPNLALTIAGYITSIAVFCDSGFVILNSINKSLAKKSKLSITVTSVSLATGLFASHCLIPPATGPIAAAQILGTNIGLLMIVGSIVAVFAAGAGFLWATFFAKKYYVEPDIAESYEELIGQYGQLPSIGKAIMPILVPIILILIASIANPKLGLIPKNEYISIIFFLGNPAVALIIGVFTALFLLVPRSKYREAVNEWFTEGIKRAALIVAITGAGGAFGQVLKGSPIGGYLGITLASWHLGIFLPFIISAALKTAQGSSTVALITASSIIAPLLPTLGLNPILATAAVGAGAMTFSHANDSYFWVVTQFSNLETSISYRVFSLATLIEGLTAMVIIFIISLFI
jgi:gluconate:H+ symporter, GntP family